MDGMMSLHRCSQIEGQLSKTGHDLLCFRGDRQPDTWVGEPRHVQIAGTRGAYLTLNASLVISVPSSSLMTAGVFGSRFQASTKSATSPWFRTKEPRDQPPAP